jgi:hypothetical protein
MRRGYDRARAAHKGPAIRLRQGLGDVKHQAGVAAGAAVALAAVKASSAPAQP